MTVFSRGAPPEGRPERKHHFERGVNKAFYRKGLNVGRFFVPARGSEKKGEEIGIARCLIFLDKHKSRPSTTHKND